MGKTIRPTCGNWRRADSGGVPNYLNDARQLIILESVDTDNIMAQTVPYASSGLAKIHSLASEDGLVIFDSRVSAAIGECINHYLREVGEQTIPDVLKVPRAADRIPTPVGNVNHPGFTRDYRWIEAQVRVSWLLHAALDDNPQIFPKHDHRTRAHMLEAALFMMGAKVGPAHHQFPAVQL